MTKMSYRTSVTVSMIIAFTICGIIIFAALFAMTNRALTGFDPLPAQVAPFFMMACALGKHP